MIHKLRDKTCEGNIDITWTQWLNFTITARPHMGILPSLVHEIFKGHIHTSGEVVIRPDK